MARLESIAVGGYYPTPPKVVPRLAALLDVGPRHSFLDPCAGEGAAILALINELECIPSLYTVELEKTRHNTLQDRIGKEMGYSARHESLQGDAFKVDFAGDGVSCLYLNPPYDIDPVHGRLEERFLSRFTEALADDGVLIFLVPFYALKASATTLATYYTDVACYHHDAERALLITALRRATEGWGRRMFGEIAPAAPDGDPHPSFARVIRDLRLENMRLRTELMRLQRGAA